jgi:hypothetical protein
LKNIKIVVASIQQYRYGDGEFYENLYEHISLEEAWNTGRASDG